jgi:AraC-like DNA-binding protein/mannose-6-phosphate isomerase-like protein (cupin superfamily)
MSDKYFELYFDDVSGIPKNRFTDKINAKPQRLVEELESSALGLPEVLGFAAYDYQGEDWKAEYHDLHELIFVIGGKGSFVFESCKETVSFQEGDVLLVRPGETHRPTRDSRYKYIVFRYRFPASQMRLGKVSSKKSSKKSTDKKYTDPFLRFLYMDYPDLKKISLKVDSQIIPKVRLMLRESAYQSPGKRYLLGLYCMELLILIARNHLGKNLPEDKASVKKSGSKEVLSHHEIIVQDSLRIINYNYRTLDTQGLVHSFGLHPHYFRSIFKRVTGSSLSAYVLEKRLEEAKKLLAETEQSTREISHYVGIKSYQYFHRAFTARYKASPKSYRERHKVRH